MGESAAEVRAAGSARGVEGGLRRLVGGGGGGGGGGEGEGIKVE